jgi:hypothetical protein
MTEVLRICAFFTLFAVRIEDKMTEVLRICAALALILQPSAIID